LETARAFAETPNTARTDATTFDTLKCVAFNERRQVHTDAGELFVEIGVVVAAPNNSAAEHF